MSTSVIKVERPFTEYHDRGLIVPLNEVGRLAPVVTVFDRDLNFTRHNLVTQTREKAELSPAVPWDER